MNDSAATVDSGVEQGFNGRSPRAVLGVESSGALDTGVEVAFWKDEGHSMILGDVSLDHRALVM